MHLQREREKERKELWDFYRIYVHKDQEIVEGEISNVQIIRVSQIGEC